MWIKSLYPISGGSPSEHGPSVASADFSGEAEIWILLWNLPILCWFLSNTLLIGTSKHKQNICYMFSPGALSLWALLLSQLLSHNLLRISCKPLWKALGRVSECHSFKHTFIVYLLYSSPWSGLHEHIGTSLLIKRPEKGSVTSVLWKTDC